MSDISITDDQTTPSSAPSNQSHGLKVAKPDLYHGDRSKLEDWLLQFDLFFTFQGSTIQEDQKTKLAASYMRGQAFRWIKPFIKNKMDETSTEEDDVWLEDWTDFKIKIRQIFGVSNEPVIARRNIQRIRQTTSAADYAADFQALACETDWDDTALMTMFRQGLKPKVKEELMRTGATLGTLKQLVDEAISIDIRLYELQLELRDDPRARTTTDKRPPPRNPWRNNLSNRGQRGSNHYRPNTGRRIHNDTSSGYYGPAAMDLSNINKGPEKGKYKGKGNSKDVSKVTCYSCGKTGHFSRDCQTKNKVVRQLNMLTTDDNGTSDEWEILTDDIGCLEMDTESDSDDQRGVTEAYDRAPTPHQEPEDILITDTARYHAVRLVREHGRIGLGDIHNASFVKRGSKYFTHKGQELLVITMDSIGEDEVLRTSYRQGYSARKQAREKAEELASGQLRVAAPLGSAKEQTRSKTPHPGNWCEKQLAMRATSEPEETDDEEVFYESPEERRVAIARTQLYMRDDTPGFTGFNLQLHNAELTEKDWEDITFKKWAQDNTATQADLDLSNRFTPAKDEPDFCQDPAPSTTNRTIEYMQDHRNSKHRMLDWQLCHHDGCKEHYLRKAQGHWMPSPRGKCPKKWYQCERSHCVYHLWDKRNAPHFPGITDPQEILTMQLVLNEWCNNEIWEECLNAACKRHLVQKEVCGFQDVKAFLGQRTKAPGIDPSIPLGPITSSNSLLN